MRRLSFVAILLTFAATITARAQLNDSEAKTIATDNATSQPAATTTFPVKPPVLPPKWAFGVLFGSYYDQAKVLDAIQKLRNDYCGDLMWIDSSWLSGNYTDRNQNHYINFTFDPGQFPDPKSMTATLRQNHFHFGVWEWPFIDKSITPLYTYGEEHHLFVTDQKGGTGKVVNGGGWHGVKFTGQFDFTNPSAVQWFVTLNKPLTDMGLDFVKIDTYSSVPKGGVTFDGSDSDFLRLGYHKATYEVTRGDDPNKRGFYLAHHNPTPDNNQYPGMWTGDVKTSWAGFVGDMKIASNLNTPDTAAYWCSDTGGYAGDLPSPGSDELYIRWLQYGTFCPINEFFSSKGAKGRFPWLFNQDAQRNFKFYTQLRYRLLPFRYSNAQAAWHESPIKYPVHFVDGTQDEIIVGNGDSELLVAPVHEEHAISRQVKLPEGKWINYWTGETLDGNTSSTIDAPLDHVPFFIKAGAIIPVGLDIHYVDEKPADPLTLDIYPAGKTTYTLYEDDGITNNYQHGQFTKTTFTSDADNHVLDISPAEGDYPGKLATRTHLLKFNAQTAAPATVTRNGEALAQSDDIDNTKEGWHHDPQSKITWIKFTTPTNVAVTISIAPAKQ